MGLEAVYPRKRTTIPGGLSGIAPCRLRGLEINRPNQVVCADIKKLTQDFRDREQSPLDYGQTAPLFCYDNLSRANVPDN